MSSRKGHQDRGLQQRLGEEILRELCLFSLEKRWLWEDLMAVFSVTVRRLLKRWSQALLGTAWQKDETKKDSPGGRVRASNNFRDAFLNVVFGNFSAGTVV